MVSTMREIINFPSDDSVYWLMITSPVAPFTNMV